VQPFIAAYVVRDGKDTCCVGFLSDCAIKHRLDYDGLLVQCIEFAGATSDKDLQKRAKNGRGLVRTMPILTVWDVTQL
jgi:hypothetical protein